MATETSRNRLTELSKSMLVIPALLPVRAPLASQRPEHTVTLRCDWSAVKQVLIGRLSVNTTDL